MLLEALASGGGAELDLLWQNPTPTANFAEKTITSSSSGWVSGKNKDDYNYFIIIPKYSTTDERKPRVPTLFKNNMTYKNGFSYASTNANVMRTIQVKSNGFLISQSIGGGEVGTYNNLVIPLYILGVKGIDDIEKYIN